MVRRLVRALVVRRISMNSRFLPCPNRARYCSRGEGGPGLVCGRFTLTSTPSGGAGGASSSSTSRSGARAPLQRSARPGRWLAVRSEDGAARRAARACAAGASSRPGRRDPSRRASGMINARIETAARAARPSARPCGTRRCLVPADGFYEWGGSRARREAALSHRRYPAGGALRLRRPVGAAGRDPDGRGARVVHAGHGRGRRRHPSTRSIDRMPVIVQPAVDYEALARPGRRALVPGAAPTGCWPRLAPPTFSSLTPVSNAGERRAQVDDPRPASSPSPRPPGRSRCYELSRESPAMTEPR